MFCTYFSLAYFSCLINLFALSFPYHFLSVQWWCTLSEIKGLLWKWYSYFDLWSRAESSISVEKSYSNSFTFNLSSLWSPELVGFSNVWKILKEMGIPDHLTYLLRNLYADQEATVRTGHGTTDWFQIGKAVHRGCILSPCLFNLCAECITRNARLDEAQASIEIARRNINNLRYTDDTTLWQKGKRTWRTSLREAWHAAVHDVAKSRTWLSDWTELKEGNICILS